MSRRDQKQGVPLGTCSVIQAQDDSGVDPDSNGGCGANWSNDGCVFMLEPVSGLNVEGKEEELHPKMQCELRRFR